MKKNLILSAAIGYNFSQIEFFLKSLRKFYKDEICLIVSQNNFELEQKLKKFNCDMIKSNIDKKKIQFERYGVYSEFLKDKEYKNILLCDSRDIYFQDDPFHYNFGGSINFFLEDNLIKNCPFNSNWILKTYGKKGFKQIFDKTILCSGTVLGKSEKIKEYLLLMKKNILKYKYKKRIKYLFTFRTDPEGRGCDQGHANYIVHNSLIKNAVLHSNNDGPFATAFYLKKIRFDQKYRLINHSGNHYLLVHQYDKRWKEFSDNVKKFEQNL
tara:strand:+ start:413 stop:1219 length:807 start_codon:yes stop_codon:yes gene_type:complete